MAVKGKVLSFVISDPGTGDSYEVSVGHYQRFLKSLMIDEEEIQEKVMRGLEPFKNRLMNMGLTGKEADAKIAELLKVEGE